MNEIEERLKIAMPRIAVKFQNELVKACPVDRGGLRVSIKVMPQEDGLLIWMNITGKYVEFGTPPHIIEPRNKKALMFEIGRVERLSGKKKGKNIVFAKKVRHPGTRPNPFIRNTIRNKLQGIIIEELMKA